MPVRSIHSSHFECCANAQELELPPQTAFLTRDTVENATNVAEFPAKVDFELVLQLLLVQESVL